MEFIRKLWHLFRHLGDPVAWGDMVTYIGTANMYVLLVAIVFCETGLVVTPFLPGDSLLFMLGAMGTNERFQAAAPDFNLPLITALLIVAAVLGDAANYWIGYKLGPRVFNRDEADATHRPWMNRLLNRKHLLKAQAFYETYGGKTIILARFVPVVRTFAPFVAGIGRMNYLKFALYNVVGAIAWVLLCVGAGVKFGGFEFVKKNFELVIVAIVVISVVPMAIEFLRARRAAKAGGSAVVEATTVGRSETGAAE